MSSAQIRSTVLVILMILSVTRLFLIATSLYTLQPKCVFVCVSQVSMHDSNIVNSSFIPSQSSLCWMLCTSSQTIYSFPHCTHHCVKMRESPRLKTKPPNEINCSYASLFPHILAIFSVFINHFPSIQNINEILLCMQTR